jgi:hypothetical protein
MAYHGCKKNIPYMESQKPHQCRDPISVYHMNMTRYAIHTIYRHVEETHSSLYLDNHTKHIQIDVNERFIRVPDLRKAISKNQIHVAD